MSQNLKVINYIRLSNYDDNGKRILYLLAKKIDVCDSHTVVFGIGYTHVIPLELSSVNIVDGLVTVFFINGSYMTLERTKC